MEQIQCRETILATQPWYALVDSGDGEKLERFGDRTLIRPSSLAVWKRSQTKEEWQRSSARFFPGEGWKGRIKGDDTGWDITVHGITFRLRLQQNGQVGIFPEHSAYLEIPALKKLVAERREVRVLNLFAFSGLASLVLAQQGMHVTHVDLSKRALEWAGENIRLNPTVEGQIRLIKEDALEFVAREVRRGKRYHVVIADPPNFSRISKKESWNFEQIFQSLMEKTAQLLERECGVWISTCHGAEAHAETMANLIWDNLGSLNATVVQGSLGVREERSPRILRAGSIAYSWWGL